MKTFIKLMNIVKRGLNYIIRVLSQYVDLIRIISSVEYKHLRNKKSVIFIATPIYGNLGDHAIITSQIQFIEDISLGNEIVEISCSQYHKFKKILAKFISPKDIIAIDGGGNMGTLWMNEEEKMREIVRIFHDNPIIIFPQTAFFEDSEFGNKELKKSIKIYASHTNLTIFCRDTNTYSLIKNKIPSVKSYYVPDIVLYNETLNFSNTRNGILLCLREDLEKTNSIDIMSIIEKYFHNHKINSTSTVIEERINRKNRKYYLNAKLKEFSKAELVITDRLHGMLFSAITGTPCVALDNKSHKVKQGYEWIKYLPYIYYCDNENDFIKSVEQVSSKMGCKFKYDRTPLNKYYSTISEVILREFERE